MSNVKDADDGSAEEIKLPNTVARGHATGQDPGSVVGGGWVMGGVGGSDSNKYCQNTCQMAKQRAAVPRTGQCAPLLYFFYSKSGRAN